MSADGTTKAPADLDEGALFYHRYPAPGKLEIRPTKPLGNQRDLALAYSPGVAAPCLAIHDDPATAAHYTGRAGVQAGDGGQGGPVQEVRRYRRFRHRDRRP
jgi:malate dehydrogenase (oxaloacetate-decarboxylating)(NADP+)